jgi:para-nitrobenzyl esterase
MALLKAHTACGTVVGMPTTYQASTIFKGIPYAKPPVGELRWRAPQPAEPWEGEFLAYTYGDIPIQKRPPEGDFFRKEFYPIEWPSSEDCLYMNVITPAETPDEKLPVALWVYGGGFVQGYSQKLETDGEAFAQRGVIYVSFNYRVGPFGYLSCEMLDAEAESGVSGNYGLLDQIAALDWVRQNIAAFGGDPDRITVFGQSAGAMSVYDLLCSPLSKGKIAGAIMESGGGPIPTMLNEPGVRAYCQKFLESFGKDGLDELRQIEGHNFFQGWLDFMAKEPPMPLPLNPAHGDEALPKDLLQTFRDGEVADIPCIIGTTAEEDRAYGDGSPEGPTGMRDGFLGGAIAFADKQAQAGRTNAYVYHLTNTPPGEPSHGAHHSSEHFYIFQTLLRSWRPYTGKDYELSRVMCDYWTNFVKTGNPNAEELPEWRPWTAADKQAMRLDREGCGMFDIPAYNGVARTLAQDALGE